jgi:hypothetical protein
LGIAWPRSKQNRDECDGSVTKRNQSRFDSTNSDHDAHNSESVRLFVAGASLDWICLPANH